MARYNNDKICIRVKVTKDSNGVITGIYGDKLYSYNINLSIPLGTKLHFTPVCISNNITYAYSYDNPVPEDYIELSNFI